jgi:hypothetical protein
MSTFTERPEEFTPELQEAAGWLQQEVERVAAEKDLRDIRWELRYGQRENGGTGGIPRIVQWGFQVTGIHTATGEALPLHVFLDEDTVTENPELARRILDLWSDRVETGGHAPPE